jgi:hypothetical protein
MPRREIRPVRRLTYDRPGDQSETNTQTARRANKAELKLHQIPTPATYKEAITGDWSNEWRAGVEDEWNSLVKNKTWELVELPADRKALKTKWVFKLKEREDGSIRYKARLVVKGYLQVAGVDYQETFAPVMRAKTLRILLGVANQNSYHIHQMDVKTAFLYGKLDEEIYMEQPEGYIKEGQETKVCKLKKSLYGLKQAPRVWNREFDRFLTQSLRFTRSQKDHAIYTRGAGAKKVIIGVYVDDLLIVGPNLTEIQRVKNALAEKFEMQDFGQAKNILGMQLEYDRTEGHLTLSQEKYARSILRRFNMEDCTPITNPLTAGKKYSRRMQPTTEKEKQEMEKIP